MCQRGRLCSTRRRRRRRWRRLPVLTSFSARVSTDGRRYQQGKTGPGQIVPVKWTATAILLGENKKFKHRFPATIPSYNAIFLATPCLLTMHFMLYLLLSSPSREKLALTLPASRAVQHCALSKSQQP